MTKTLPGGKKPDDRLRLLIDLVGSCERVIDIGTDHALLPIRLVEEGKCGCVIAIDSSISAFTKAQRNVAKAEAGNKITVLHGSGLKNVEVKVEDTLVLAGLGGREIISILSEKLPLPGNV
ncbi:MAG TPA: SAM-dependent methyltransferase, partial [Clostridiaceae bacterium]|nr:SAM-dependent methyltransferase [Clostridiaceae bacterium]